jgi:mono/diheme cytochrome c family protein
MPRPRARAVAAALAAALAAVVPPAAAPAQEAPGAAVFREHCEICHGPRGDGRGHAAHHFASPPRDFTPGRYKFRSTASGQLPTDDDLRRSIIRGIPGTGMVPQDQLSDAELGGVIAYIKSLASRFATAPPPAPVAFVAEPGRTAEAVARGQRVYVKAECRECHGDGARGDGPSARDLAIKPSDLTRRPLKSGLVARDIVRTLVTGLDGTPMPSYHLVLDDAELWDLAYYVESLGGPPALTDDERWGRHVVHMHRQRGR